MAASGGESMKRLIGQARAALAAAFALLLGGCLFPNSLSVFSFEGVISISAGNIDLGTCFQEPDNNYLCFPDDLDSRFRILSLPELLFRLVLLDPIVLQLPAGASNFAGSFLHTNSGTSGALAITAGLNTVRIDLDRQLTAEPGMQLVVIGLPAGAPTTGTFSFNFNFSPPAGATSVVVKPIVTGLVELTNGSVFYPPIYPCVTSMATATAITIPIPVPGDTLTLPPRPPGLACQNVAYDYGGAAGPAVTANIPLLGPWLLAALAGLIGAIGARRLRRR
jgi:hypothetical protein